MLATKKNSTTDKIIFFVLAFLIPCHALSQIFPKEGSELNYRLVGFAFPVKKTDAFRIEIAKGNYTSDVEFKKNIIRRLDTNTNKLIIEVPDFNAEYTWRVVHTKSNSSLLKGTFYHFSTTNFPETDTVIKRLRIGQEAMKYKDAYVFVDDHRALYDMKGQPVWYLPAIEGSNLTPRDLKLTPEGTITCIIRGKIYEINFNGDILWKGPDNNNDTQNYHHDFTRLSNGHYMVLGNEFVFWKLASRDSNLLNFPGYKVIRDANNDLYERIQFGTIKEYDEHSKLIWSWNCADYFKKSDLYIHRNKQGLFDIDVHENAFFFDENKKNVYVSFRGISRILKIKYPDGDITEAYGNAYAPGMTEMGNSLFCEQHGIRKSEEGYLYLFNNNNCNIPDPPSIVMMEEPSAGGKELKKIWEYPCNFEHQDITKRAKLLPGGNVIELPDHSIFAQVCWANNVVCIVSRDKQLIWNAYPENWDNNKKKWVMSEQYRSSIIVNPKDVERLVWDAETK